MPPHNYDAWLIHELNPWDSLVIGESHMALSQPNRVLSFANAVKDLEVLFRDTSFRKVHFNSLDTDIGRSGGNIELRGDVDGSRDGHYVEVVIPVIVYWRKQKSGCLKIRIVDLVIDVLYSLEARRRGYTV